MKILDKIKEIKIPELRDAILQRVDEDVLNNNSIYRGNCMSDILFCSFDWESSSEGHDYWLSIYTMLLEIESI